MHSIYISSYLTFLRNIFFSATCEVLYIFSYPLHRPLSGGYIKRIRNTFCTFGVLPHPSQSLLDLFLSGSKAWSFSLTWKKWNEERHKQTENEEEEKKRFHQERKRHPNEIVPPQLLPWDEIRGRFLSHNDWKNHAGGLRIFLNGPDGKWQLNLGSVLSDLFNSNQVSAESVESPS